MTIDIKAQLAQLKTLSWVGYAEGTSFLLLLFIAMPVKYYLNDPILVKWIGMGHGLLFIAYLVVLFSTASKVKLPLWGMPMGTIAAILPFGPFVFDYMLKKQVSKKLLAAADA